MESNWYCSLPWRGFSNDPDGRVRPCCLYKDHIKDNNDQPMYVQTHTVKEIFSSQYMKNLRDQFRKGARPKECITCIKDEENNYTSKRQRYIKSELGKNVNFLEEPEYPVEYQMIISNTSSDNILYAADGYDITQEVTDLLNERCANK